MSRNSRVLFGLLFASIHGFRMPLFVLVSGYFTMMLWRRRGMRALLQQRVQRVLIPCLLGLVTIVPALRWVSSKANEQVVAQDARRKPAVPGRSELAEAVKTRDLEGLERQLADDADRRGDAAGRDRHRAGIRVGLRPVGRGAVARRMDHRQSRPPSRDPRSCAPRPRATWSRPPRRAPAA